MREGSFVASGPRPALEIALAATWGGSMVFEVLFVGVEVAKGGDGVGVRRRDIIYPVIGATET